MADEDLTGFVEAVTGDSHLRVEDDLGDGFVRLRSAEAERRQAKHDIRVVEDIIIEMLRNARDAGARSVFVATSREGDTRTIVMIDDGDGIPDHLREAVFEPRVTSKLDSVRMDTWGVHGRGMALYSIKVNARSARVVETAMGQGTSIEVVVDLTALNERRDQSTAPNFFRDENGTLHIRGPRNIIRTVSEFAYLDRESISVYLGSMTEIAATLYAFGCASTTSVQRTFTSAETLPVCKRLSAASDPDAFVDIAAGLGITLSSRSARRILDGSIEPLEDVASTIRPAEPDTRTEGRGNRASGAGKDGKGLSISPDDLREFSSGVSECFADIARGYYLDPDVEPRIRCTGGTLSVSIPLIKTD